MMAAPVHHHERYLSELLQGVVAIPACEDVVVSGVQIDSRIVRRGDLFLACRGGRTHGVDYISEALRQGTVAIVYDPEGANGVHPLGVPAIAVAQLSDKVGLIADRFHGHPSAALQVIGITGTNGKTSCCHYLAQALNHKDAACGVIGTLGNGLFGALDPGVHTTPDALTVHATLSDLRQKGAHAVVMEVSSHALNQGRVGGVAFDAAVFTNLSRDHLDYHGDMASYEATKRRLFHWPDLGCAVINADDSAGRRLLRDLPPVVRAVAYSLNAEANQSLGTTAAGCPIRHLWATEVTLSSDGLRMEVDGDWGRAVLGAPLLGRFNASNLLATLATLLAQEWTLEQAVQRLAGTRAVAGRMERFSAAGRALLVVDYAHTPDALEQALLAVREHTQGMLWCVFGCGGERDQGKRPQMGAIAERLADRVVITDDNPRGEKGDAIVADIRAGLSEPGKALVERDRQRAVHAAYAAAEACDVVLVAGKGHENYQEVAGRRMPYSDRTLAAQLTGGGA
ncbi:MAG: UDP-N-acetylmuramoyl-L-alanyl-D-glutamate--2,6-diaminopimelate ligase [Proteobacteria bacterium]|nr:MAG: UDP-N-acetylmuramoyl-L-alanyl-D-glutamate--2,6-diaminopimelate ligase [Pseudomonadota bacterium]